MCSAVQEKVKEKVTQSCLTLWLHELHSPGNSPGQNTEMGSFTLLQGIFPTQELNPGLLHCRQIIYQLSYQGSPCARKAGVKNQSPGIPWQWLGLGAFTAEGAGLIPGWGTKDPPNLVARPKKEKKIKAHHSPSCYISLLLGGQYL